MLLKMLCRSGPLKYFQNSFANVLFFSGLFVTNMILSTTMISCKDFVSSPTQLTYIGRNKHFMNDESDGDITFSLVDNIDNPLYTSRVNYPKTSEIEQEASISNEKKETINKTQQKTHHKAIADMTGLIQTITMDLQPDRDNFLVAKSHFDSNKHFESESQWLHPSSLTKTMHNGNYFPQDNNNIRYPTPIFDTVRHGLQGTNEQKPDAVVPVWQQRLYSSVGGDKVLTQYIL